MGQKDYWSSVYGNANRSSKTIESQFGYGVPRRNREEVGQILS